MSSPQSSEGTRSPSDLLKAYPKAIMHMRQQHERARFGLVLGAGVSSDYNLPQWNALVDRLANDPLVDGSALLTTAKTGSATTLTEMLFQRFRNNSTETIPQERPADKDRRIRREWIALLRRHLYADAKPLTEIMEHPYLKHYAPLVLKSPLTVTYNFDDRLERLLDADRGTEQSVRGYETVWSPSAQFRMPRGVIYHPNGYLPERRGEAGSNWVVFSEESFADQLIESMRGEHTMLLAHLASTTCLLLGLSLNDATLRHLLRQCALLNSDHIHYHVSVLKESMPLAVNEQDAIRNAQFEVYNLVTLFLAKGELSALGHLLTMSDDDFEEIADRNGLNDGFCYYISGAVGAGKTTTVGMCRSHSTHDEWPDPPPENLFRQHLSLEAQERLELDRWIDKQFAKKNVLLLRNRRQLQVVDRCPLDPLAFTPAEDLISRACSIRSAVRPGVSQRRLRSGQVLLLQGDPSEMAARAKDQARDADRIYLAQQQSLIQQVYSGLGVVTIDVRGLNPLQVTRRVVRHIHLGSYDPAFDLDARLEEFANGSAKLNGILDESAAAEQGTSSAASELQTDPVRSTE